MHNEEYLHVRLTPSMRINKCKLEEKQGRWQAARFTKNREGERVNGIYGSPQSSKGVGRREQIDEHLVQIVAVKRKG